ncbi:NAD(P)/FAD-dependent oxidoreductase [Aureispira anguillae]|uniref:NAD(P)/FAD-dependent oxidoreductase n=1 Tax=Aureispira anguillae TaxID=2864201 RepID=A0A916DX63_9BACT|nr:FAD/NAD(P)-binding oxidoreductase [Aureispira anguillae]BDS15552.1 NAD(P)/FAD-dependent oxidoreductase [Aureispira anguillae]
MTHKYSIVIVGAGTAGITVAAQLLKQKKGLNIAIIDPAKTHYYQPAWTLVGAGTYDYESTARPMQSLIPKGVTWLQEYVTTFEPIQNQVRLKNGDLVAYDYLVVCPGIQLNLDGIEGLKETLGKNNVCSNYVDANYTWQVLQNFKGGNALFTQPATPIKCGGAPQKIMYLADDYFQQQHLKPKTNMIFASPGSVIFGVADFAKTLMQVVDRKDIHLKFFHKLVKIDGPNQLAYYEITRPADSDKDLEYNINPKVKVQQTGLNQIAIPFDMLHLAPPQSAPDFIRNSPLAHQEGPSKGWLNVDHFTLQHNVYPNIYGLGDAAALPTAKTGAAIRKQAPVVVAHLINAIQQKNTNLKYNGYSSCPLVTGYGKMVLAEFGYNNVRMSDPLISKFVDTSKETYSMWLLKKYGLPPLYWKLMLKGRI